MKSFLKYAIIVVTVAVITYFVTTVMYVINGIDFDSLNVNTRGNLAAKISAINTYIDEEYLYDDYSQKKLNEAALKAYVEALDEPYSHYYTKEEFESYISGVEDSYVGIGVVISVDEEVDKIIVVAPTKDSPAYNAGIMPGDYIIAVDGTKYNGDEMDECVSAIKSGREGTTVTVTVEHNGVEKDYVIKRAEISSNSVESEMLDDKVAYIRITSFNTNNQGSDEDTFTEFKDSIETLQDKGMKKLVIDLRDNPGGVLEVVCKISDYLLPEGIITYTETKSGERTEFKSDSDELDIPIVVLVNGNSASASEILTGALKDFERAVVVGETTFGKGIVQSVLPFLDGSGMSLTTAKYYTPGGVCIHGVGIEPDYAVEPPEAYKDYYASQIPAHEDVQLQKALEILEKK